MRAVAAIDSGMPRTARAPAACRRLMTFSGVGQLIALAFVATIAQIPLKKPSSILSDGEARRVSEKGLGGPEPPSRALCGQHSGKHIDRS
jgi:hypothetical protein